MEPTRIDVIRQRMEDHLLSVAGDVPDADTAECHLETWLSDFYGKEPVIREMSLSDVRKFISATVRRFF